MKIQRSENASLPKAVALVQWLDCFDKSLTLVRQYVKKTPVGTVTAADAADVEDAADRVVSALVHRWEQFPATPNDVQAEPELDPNACEFTQGQHVLGMWDCAVVVEAGPTRSQVRWCWPPRPLTWRENYTLRALNDPPCQSSQPVTEPGSVPEPSTVDSGCSSKEGESV